MRPTPRWRASCSTDTSREVLVLVAGASPLVASAAAPHLGDVLGQLAHRCAHRVPLAARGPAQAAAARQQGGRDQQRCRAGRVTAQRRLRRRQSHPALYHRLRPRRGEPRRSGHHLYRRAAPDHPADRARPAGGRGRTRPAAASPRTSTSASSASRSPRRSPAPPWSNWYAPMPPPLRPVTS